MLSANDILDRAKEHLSVKTDTELAKKLDIAQSTLANWRSRESLNLPAVISKCNDCDLNWLLLGKKASIPIWKRNNYEKADDYLEALLFDMEVQLDFFEDPDFENEQIIERLSDIHEDLRDGIEESMLHKRLLESQVSLLKNMIIEMGSTEHSASPDQED